jgi:sucrose-6F-phosphate phosphohydrolase
MERVRLLITDLDGTLLGNAESLRAFAAWRRRAGGALRLVYSSGRFLNSVRASIEEFELPTPDAIICGVGTEIYDVAANNRLEEWPRLRSEWNPAAVATVCLTRETLRLQPAEFLSKFKISFYGHELDDAFLSRLSHDLTNAGQCASIIYSSNRDLDVLPAGTHKGAAATYLARSWKFNFRDVIVAGDSGNDLSMFHEGFSGVIVGNAQPELRSFAGSNAFHAQRPFAAGVLEGLHHWWAESRNRALQPLD